MVLRDAEVIPGHAGVFPAVCGLRHVDLQRSVLMEDVSVSLQHAGAAVLKPGQDNPIMHSDLHTDRPITTEFAVRNLHSQNKS